MKDLYEHQKEFLALNPDKYLLAWECGVGKSLAAIKWADKRKGRTLVVCPISVVQKWKRDIKDDSEFAHLYTVITKEDFKKLAAAAASKNFDVLIVDEAHFFAGFNPTSQMSKSMLAYVKKWKIEDVLMLTATPYMSRPWNVFRLGQILGKAWDYRDWDREFYNYVPMGFRRVPMLKANSEPAVARYVREIGNTRTLAECADVPKDNNVEEYFALTPEQEKLMKSTYDANPIVRFTRQHQVCGGTLKGDDFVNDIEVPCHKRARVLELADEEDKLVVVCHHRLEVQSLKHALEKHGVANVYAITGDTKDRESLIEEARKKEKAVLIITSAISEGWEFPEARVMVFYSYDFSLKNYVQMRGRIQRINNLAKRTYLSLIVEGTIDEDVFKCIAKKKNFLVHIYARSVHV